MTVGLYIHIPFCQALCHYCDFVKFINRESQIDPYLNALAKEMCFYQGEILQTLYIGGGTPTVLRPEQIGRLLRSVHQSFDSSRLTEATVEANPESAEEDRLAAYLEGGINRLSLGLQSMENDLLNQLGRLHDREKFEQAFALSRRLGFKNINVDLMFGLPGQTIFHWEKTLQDVAALGPEHISTYALKIEHGTKLAHNQFVVDDDLQADMYLLASQTLTARGYIHYEISNFAKAGKESRHNLR
jgi:oxygen-independent coproporphyrinogen-3 oxidase